jgi:hypothetical protein
MCRDNIDLVFACGILIFSPYRGEYFTGKGVIILN